MTVEEFKKKLKDKVFIMILTMSAFIFIFLIWLFIVGLWITLYTMTPNIAKWNATLRGAWVGISIFFTFVQFGIMLALIIFNSNKGR